MSLFFVVTLENLKYREMVCKKTINQNQLLVLNVPNLLGFER